MRAWEGMAMKSGFGHFGGVYFPYSSGKTHFTCIVPVSSYCPNRRIEGEMPIANVGF